jgi:hypothetical protein
LKPRSIWAKAQGTRSTPLRWTTPSRMRTAAVAWALALEGHGQAVLGVEIQHVAEGAVEQRLAGGVQQQHDVVAAARTNEPVIVGELDLLQAAVQHRQIGQAQQRIAAVGRLRLDQVRCQRPGFGIALVRASQPQSVGVLDAGARPVPGAPADRPG